MRLFNGYGANDTYGQSFPSRWSYAEEHLRRLNGTPDIAAVIEEVLDPRNFFDSELDPEQTVSVLNQYLAYDGYRLILSNGLYKVRPLRGTAVELDHSRIPLTTLDEGFVREQIDKCEEKIATEDYDGAITNARSLLEAILVVIERDLDPNAPEYDGDLVKLYRRAQKLLNLDPSRQDIDSTLKQVLSGLTSIVGGLAGVRNKMSDSHVRSYKPHKHHARFAVNAAKTVADFLVETRNYQLARGTVGATRDAESGGQG